MSDLVMTDKVQSVFLDEIEQQCGFAFRAAAGLDASLRSESDKPWFHLHALVIAAANVSKLLWNDQEKIPGRCRALREALGVDEGSPLKLRGMRNRLEHYDERIEAWVSKSERHNMVRDCIGPAHAVVGVDPCDYHRHYDPSSGTFWLWGNDYAIRPIVDELNKIKNQLGGRRR